jgi:hypothetical protein
MSEPRGACLTTRGIGGGGGGYGRLAENGCVLLFHRVRFALFMRTGAVMCQSFVVIRTAAVGEPRD